MQTYSISRAKGIRALKIGLLNRVISVISVVLGKTTVTFSVLLESEIVRVVSRSTKEISKITRLRIRSSGSGYLK